MILQRQNVLKLILIFSLLFTFFLVQRASAATTISISLSYSFETIPVTSSYLGAITEKATAKPLYLVRVEASVSGIGGLIGKNLTFSDPGSTTARKVGTASSISPSYKTTQTYEVRGVTPFSVTASINDGTYTGTKTSTITPQLAADYDAMFNCTCYITALESDYPSTGKTATMSGITGSYHPDFKAAVIRNGSGKTTGGQYIKYMDGGTFSWHAPETKSGTTPSGSRTIAVDVNKIPMSLVSGTWQRAKVNIVGVGLKQAEDIGPAISS
ncbi:MAG: hypothetical protein J7559_07745, partial [Cohnella sp.]|nr:hypothetical protein [Cohnella sp.]